MPTEAAPKTSFLARAATLFLTLPVVILGVGFIFHTSFDPTVFGKYSTGYFLFLCGWFLLVIPAAYLFARFVFGTQYVVLSGGRKAPVRPLPKILLATALAVVLVNVANRSIERKIRRGVSSGSDTFHPYLQNTPGLNRSRLNTNRWGFRGDAIELRKPAGTYRIFMLGGSTVFCGRLPHEETHAAVLEARLREARPGFDIEVQNAGGDWHTSQHSLIKFLFDVQDFDPDLIIIYHGINDLSRSFSPDVFAHGPYRADYGHFHGSVASLVRPEETRGKVLSMQFGHWFSDFRFDRVRPHVRPGAREAGASLMFFPKAREEDISFWPSLDAFRRNMTDLGRIARSKGVDLVIASQPFLYRTDLTEEEREVIWVPMGSQQDGVRPSIRSMIEGMNRFNATSRAVAADVGAGFVDLETIVPKTTECFVDDVHYTPEACRIIGEALAEHVLASGVIESRLAPAGEGE